MAETEDARACGSEMMKGAVLILVTKTKHVIRDDDRKGHGQDKRATVCLETRTKDSAVPIRTAGTSQ